MRDYAAVKPRRWSGNTGRAIRGELEAMLVMDYLITSPHANMLGLYYLPMAYIVADLGIPFEGASKGLRRVQEVGFARYDEATEVVWVINMARDQMGERFKATDNRCKNVQDLYDSLPDNPFLPAFFDKYVDCYHLQTRRDGGLAVSPLPSPSQAPSKGLTHPLRSQDQDQDQDQEQEERGSVAAPGFVLTPERLPPKKTERTGAQIAEVYEHWRSYHPTAAKALAPKSLEFRQIKARLDEGTSVETLKRAIDGCHHTPFNLGDNEQKRKYLGLDLITRNASNVTRFAETPIDHEPKAAGSPKFLGDPDYIDPDRNLARERELAERARAGANP